LRSFFNVYFLREPNIGNHNAGHLMNETGRPRATRRSFCRIERPMGVTPESIDAVARTGPSPVAATASPE
jgi:hypothetical protein